MHSAQSLGQKLPRLRTRTMSESSCVVVGKLVVGEDRSWNNVRSKMKTTFFTSSERRGTERRRLAYARKPRPLFRAGIFQSWDARQSVRRSGVCPQNRLPSPKPSLESFDFRKSAVSA